MPAIHNLNSFHTMPICMYVLIIVLHSNLAKVNSVVSVDRTTFNKGPVS